MSDYNGVLQKDMNAKLDSILEYLAGLASVPQRLSSLEHSVANLETEANLWRALWNDHEARITKLEAN